MRQYTLLDILQAMLDQVPLTQRSKATIEFDLSKDNTSQNIEAIYQQSCQRLSQLAHYLHWSATFKDNTALRPNSPSESAQRNIGMLFNDPAKLEHGVLQSLNNDFSSWISNQILRELNEFLSYYLLNIYETCLVIDQSSSSITPKDVVGIREQSANFEKSNLKERFKQLRQCYGIAVTHTTEACSLYEIRNIFAHFDGVVQRKFCKNDGQLKMFWPANTYYLERRKDGKKIPYHRVQKPFCGTVYGPLHITWLNKPKEITYNSGDKISLSYEQMNELLFFYLYIFHELQEAQIEFCKSHEVPVRNISEYTALKPSLGAMVEEEKTA